MTEREDSEKRVQSIMNKLFNSPTRSKSISSSPGSKTSESKKSGDLAKENNSSGSVIALGGFKRSAISNRSALSSDAPMCRPWDRGDLLRRLSTFKSMTWFGKPKAVSAVNCARRGWINIEMDIIACEACGARLLFSTPSSWTQQQIEKAAAVFSLKLDSGHKLVCPWIDNACNETLAQFPPAPSPVLADGYRERSLALLRLSSLPKISSSAVDYMSSPRVESFLENSTLELGLGFTDTSTIKYLGEEHEAGSSALYYQAQKLIALCGWETRSLPYVVDCDIQTAQVAGNAHPNESSSHVSNGRNPGIIMCTTSGADEVKDTDEEQQSLSGLQSDPASVVLDCKLCGASVGLWAFSTVRRPLELYRLFGSTEVSGQKDSASCDFISSSVSGTPRTNELGIVNYVDSNGGVMSTAASTSEDSLNLNLSIAGGPPPAKQNYRATVSLPIISRHLRVGLSSNSDARDRTLSNISGTDGRAQHHLENTNSILQENDHINNTVCMQLVQPEDMGSLKRKRIEHDVCISGGDDQSCLNREFNNVVPPRNEKNDDGNSQSRECVGLGSDAIGTVENGETSKNNLSTTGEASNCQQEKGFSANAVSTSETSHHILSCEETNADIAGQTDLLNDNEGEAVQKPLEAQVSKQKLEGLKNTLQLSANNESSAAHELGKEVEQSVVDQAMEFDPIKQHRHFCPWIMSTCNAGPGWQQTLQALDRGQEPSHLLLTDTPSSTHMFEDDPITSVRKLFMSPSSTKRRKTTQGSS